MVLTPLEPITETLTSNSKESMSISTKQLEEDMSQEPSSWILSPEQWTQWELDPSVNSSDLITSFSDKLVLVTTGPRDITLKVLNLSTPSSTLWERKLKDAIVFKDSKSLILWEVVQDQEWEPFSFQKSERNTLTESWKLSPSFPPPRCPTPSLNPTTPLYQSTNWSRMQTNAWSLTTKPFMISVSEPSSSPPLLMVIWITWCPLPCQESLVVWDSPDNSTPTWESSQSTLFLSPDSTSSWLDSHPWPPEDLNNTEPWPSLNWPNKCSMLRTWCALLIPDTEDIWLPPLYSEEECPPKKLMNKCWTSKTRTVLTSLNGSPTT